MADRVTVSVAVSGLVLVSSTPADPAKVAQLRAQAPEWYARADAAAGLITQAEADAIVKAARLARRLRSSTARRARRPASD